MQTIDLLVRFFAGGTLETATINLAPARTAFLLVDCDGGPCQVVEDSIAPALRAARTAGLRVAYFHEDAYGIGGPHDITRELAGRRFGGTVPDSLFEQPQWRGRAPSYPDVIEPLPLEPDFPKDSKDGFQTTNADYYLRSWGIDTVLTVGFSLRSCLYHTSMGARHCNYRVIMLRDCTDAPGQGEFPDTVDEQNPEGGWMRFAFIRQFEINVGYTSTSKELVRACARLDGRFTSEDPQLWAGKTNELP